MTVAYPRAVLISRRTILDGPVTGRDYSVRVMLLGILQHNVYHAGQVAMLR